MIQWRDPLLTIYINAMLKQLSDQHPKKFQNILQMYSEIETLVRNWIRAGS